MYFKRVKCFYYDFFVLLFIIIVVYFAALTKIIEITINIKTFALFVSLFCLIYFIQLLNVVVRRVLTLSYDLLLKKYNCIEAVFLEQIPVESSVFSETNKFENGEIIKNVRRIEFSIILKSLRGLIVLTSASYLEIEKGVKYYFIIGRTSHIIFDVKDISTGSSLYNIN